jgi:predicted  nucleic acid-binding Zn-ribbon protein
MVDRGPSPSGRKTFRCTNCGHAIEVRSVRALPHCPNCNGPQLWEKLHQEALRAMAERATSRRRSRGVA